MCAHMFVPRGSHLALTLLTKWWRGVCRGLFLYNQLRRWRSHCVIPVYSNVAALWVLSLRHPVELLSRSKPVHSCVSPKHFGVCVCKCVWIVGSFHPSSCTSVFVCCVLLNVAVSMRVCGGRASVCVCVNSLSPLALAVRVCTRWHPLTYHSICAPPRGHPILLHRRLFIWPPVYDMQRGTLFLPLTMETRHVPYSFFTSSKPSVCLRDAVASEQVSSPLDKPVVLRPFHLDSVSGVDAPKKIIGRKKKQKNATAGGCQGMYAGCFYPWNLWCMLHVRETEKNNNPYLSILKDTFSL